MDFNSGNKAQRYFLELDKFILFFLSLVFFIFPGIGLLGQTQQTNSIRQNITKVSKNPSILATKKVVILDAPGRNGKEFRDTTIVIFSDITLYAGLFINQKFNKEAVVNWFWSDRTLSPAPLDTGIFLGTGSSFTYHPTKQDTGFIYVESLSSEQGDSTGTISVASAEVISLISTHSERLVISQGQQKISVWLNVRNDGLTHALIENVSLIFIDPNSQDATADYQFARTDSISQIPAGQSRNFTFLVNARSTADTVQVSIDGIIETQILGYSGFGQKHQWQVQSPPQLTIQYIEASENYVFQGQDNVLVRMKIANHGMASADSVNGQLTFRQEGQDISADYEYLMNHNSPVLIEGHGSAEVEFLVRIFPFARPGLTSIDGQASGIDVNSGGRYFDDSADSTTSWTVLSNTAELSISSVKIFNCPNIDEDGNADVNLDQPFSVAVTIENHGGENADNISMTLISDGSSIFQSGTSQIIDSIAMNDSHTVTFDFIAHANTLPSTEFFSAKIETATSLPSGLSAAIVSSPDSLAHVTIEHPAELKLTAKNHVLEFPVEQIFDVQAKVVNIFQNAECDSSGSLKIIVPENYTLVAGDTLQHFVQNEVVTWKIRTPSEAQGPDSILIAMIDRPRDKNSLEIAAVLTDSIYLVVEALVTALSISEVAITNPPGAIDGVVSTGQEFFITGKIIQRNIENIYAQISDIEPYILLSDSTRQSGADSILTWRIKAPILSAPDPKIFRVHAWGHEMNDPMKNFNSIDSSLTVATVDKANLKVSAKIVSPQGAVNGQIYPGLEFRIRGEIENLGQSGIIGAASLKLEINAEHAPYFTFQSDSILPASNNFAEWTVKASEFLDEGVKLFKIKILEVPNDENTDSAAFIEEDNRTAFIAVYSVGELELMVKAIPDITPTTIAPGETEIMAGIELTNLTSLSDIAIQIRLLKFDILNEAHNSIQPSSVLTGIRIRNSESVLGAATSLSANPVEIPLAIPISLNSQESMQLLAEVDFSENLTEPFKINLKDSSYINAVSAFDIVFVDQFRNPTGTFNLFSGTPVISKTDLKNSFCNYPNPFGDPQKPTTQFIYYLEKDADVELRIYTLIGELVWKRSFSHSQPQGRKGLHREIELMWDGRNSNGRKVLNGVYIARLKTGFGEWAITKVAVIK